jgi:hypothetical protein
VFGSGLIVGNPETGFFANLRTVGDKSPSRTLSGWATRLPLGIWVTDMPVVACYGG